MLSAIRYVDGAAILDLAEADTVSGARVPGEARSFQELISGFVHDHPDGILVVNLSNLKELTGWAHIDIGHVVGVMAGVGKLPLLCGLKKHWEEKLRNRLMRGARFTVFSSEAEALAAIQLEAEQAQT